MDKCRFEENSSQAKVLDAVMSIAGPFEVTLYKGPPIFMAPSPSNTVDHPVHLPNQSWVLGGILLTSEYILVPLWYIVQTQIMKEYPAEFNSGLPLQFVCKHDSCSCSFSFRRNLSARIIRPNIALASIFCSGLFGSCLNNTVHTWALHLKVPSVAAMFKPLSIIIAAVMSVMLLGDSLYLGSLIGATIIYIGFFTVIWGKAKEETVEDCTTGSEESCPTEKMPLLQSYKHEKV